MPPGKNGNSQIGFLTTQKDTEKAPADGKAPLVVNTPPITKPVAPGQSSPQSQKNVPDNPAERRFVPQQARRVGLAEALRREEIDEQRIAEVYADLIHDLENRPDDRVEKLLIEVLKECSRLLEKESPPAKSEPRIASIPIVIHNVPPPQRGPQPGGDNNSSV
jgi:hypothetical protein